MTHEQYGIVFQKGSKLRAVVNPVLKGLIKDGTVGKLTEEVADRRLRRAAQLQVQ